MAWTGLWEAWTKLIWFSPQKQLPLISRWSSPGAWKATLGMCSMCVKPSLSPFTPFIHSFIHLSSCSPVWPWLPVLFFIYSSFYAHAGAVKSGSGMVASSCRSPHLDSQLGAALVLPFSLVASAVPPVQLCTIWGWSTRIWSRRTYSSFLPSTLRYPTTRYMPLPLPLLLLLLAVFGA